MRIVRIFVSSPSDVEPERKRVDRVVARLNGAFVGQVRFETVRWETQFYGAHATFQAQIPEAAQCDIVVAILWSRLGSELPPGFPTMPNGEPYPSGTAYEVLTAIRARETHELPDVYLFRKTAPPMLAIDNDAELERARNPMAAPARLLRTLVRLATGPYPRRLPDLPDHRRVRAAG